MQILTALFAATGFVGTLFGIINWYSSYKGTQKRRNSILATIIGVIVFLTFLFISIPFPFGGYGLGGNNATPTNSTPTQGIGATATQAPTQVQQTAITQIPSTPTSNPKPAPGTVLYQADQSWSGWSGSPDWKIFNGMLANDGTSNSQEGPTIVAPYQASVSDYAVEANIQVVHWNTCCIAEFAIVVRASSTSNGWQGYSVGDDIASFAGPQYIAQAASSPGNYSSSLGVAPFSPGNASHTYRIEVKGNDIKLFIDGGLKINITDNTYLSGGQVGLWSYGVQLSITSFKITAL